MAFIRRDDQGNIVTYATSIPTSEVDLKWQVVDEGDPEVVEFLSSFS